MINYKCPSCAREHFIEGKIKLKLVICPGCMDEMVEVSEPKINIEKHAELNPFLEPRSSVKIIKNSKGINWDIKIVTGEENLIDGLMLKAIEVHNKLMVRTLEGDILDRLSEIERGLDKVLGGVC